LEIWQIIQFLSSIEADYRQKPLEIIIGRTFAGRLIKEPAVLHFSHGVCEANSESKKAAFAAF